MKKYIKKDLNIDYHFSEDTINLETALTSVLSNLIDKRRKVLRILKSNDFLRVYEYLRNEKSIMSDFIIYN